ncbi:MAG: hypothetical protein IKM10_06670 [Bacteroidaceae bacterium]|nr:hypothetical protein [Bacteroidaceae bacterium]
MIYKFLIVSDEVDDFKRVIKIDSDATFKELNDAILDSVGYTHDQMTSFFICEDDWEKTTEVTLVDMGRDSDEDIWLMEKTRLSDLVEDEGQRLMYVFDYLTDRAFFMELRETIFGEELDAPVCTKSVGDAPAQMVDFEEVEKKIAQQAAVDDLDADFYGADDYDISELDEDSFGSYDPSMDY